MKNKRGVSPVIATVLLIGMVIVLGLIIFLWMRSLAQETITKFEGENIELACNNVEFIASTSGNQLTIQNTGNVPIFDMKLKLFYSGAYDTKSSRDVLFIDSWPPSGLNPGGVFSGTSTELSNADEITLIPVLLGVSETSNQKTYTCNEKLHGQKI